jgi:hypothetical protein
MKILSYNFPEGLRKPLNAFARTGIAARIQTENLPDRS